MNELRVAVGGDNCEQESLWLWLYDERQLHGHLRRDDTPQPGTMGVDAFQVVVSLAASGTLVAFAQSLTTWLKQRRSDLSITITGPDGRQLSLNGKRIGQADAFIESLLDAYVPATKDSDTVPGSESRASDPTP